MITHDLGVVAEIADDVVVMYAGRVAEQAPVDELFKRPRHPVHVGPARLAAAPRRRSVERLVADPGLAAVAAQPAGGCRFNPRCAYAMDVCKHDDAASSSRSPLEPDAPRMRAISTTATKDARGGEAARRDDGDGMSARDDVAVSPATSCSSSRT